MNIRCTCVHLTAHEKVRAHNNCYAVRRCSEARHLDESAIDSCPGRMHRLVGALGVYDFLAMTGVLTLDAAIDWRFMKTGRDTFRTESASQSIMKARNREIFDEQYRVLEAESQSLTVQGVRSGNVLTIVNHNPDVPLKPEEYPPGKLIALSDPSSSQAN